MAPSTLFGNTVRRIVLASSSVTTVVGVPGQAGDKLSALPASVNQPVALAFVGEDLVIADTAENVVLRLR